MEKGAFFKYQRKGFSPILMIGIRHPTPLMATSMFAAVHRDEALQKLRPAVSYRDTGSDKLMTASTLTVLHYQCISITTRYAE